MERLAAYFYFAAAHQTIRFACSEIDLLAAAAAAALTLKLPLLHDKTLRKCMILLRLRNRQVVGKVDLYTIQCIYTTVWINTSVTVLSW